MARDITTKRVALLREAAPSARRFALFMHPDELIVEPQLRDIESSAPTLGIEYRTFPMRMAPDARTALGLAREWGADAVMQLAGQGMTLGTEVGRLATEFRLPSMLQFRKQVEAGGLMSYFSDFSALWPRVAVYVDRILRGATPQDLPFEFPTRFELVINLKTAKALGINIPPPLLAYADEVIE
jgi:putative ABC transport system substrate-binding protein